MKNILTALFLMFGTLCFAQSEWTKTNYPGSIYDYASKLEFHSNKLYAVSTVSGLRVYENDSWKSLASQDIDGIITGILSAGDTLFLQTTAGLNTKIYYSVNDGSTFTLMSEHQPGDATLPYKYFDGTTFFGKTYGFARLDNGNFIPLGGANSNSYSFTGSSLTYMDDTLYVFDNSGSRDLYISADKGESFELVTTNFNSNKYSLSNITADTETATLYGIGIYDFDLSTYGIYYSKNRGRTWELYNFDQVLLSNGEPDRGVWREITAFDVKNGNIYVAFNNNLKNTRPDIVSSINNLTTCSYDTLGFPERSGEFLNGIEVPDIKIAGDKVYATLPDGEIYVKDLNSSYTGISSISGTENAYIYPMPARNTLNLHGIKFDDITNIKVIATTGATIIEKTSISGTLNIQNIKPGFYIVSIQLKNGVQKQLPFIKE